MIFIFGLTAVGQTDFSGNINLDGLLSTKEDLPFWFYSNQRGRISETTSVSGLLQGKVTYELSDNSNIEFGGGIYYEDAFNDEIFIDELYAALDYKWLEIIAGSKQKAEVYNGLSASGESILWSLNARPVPGLQIKTAEPVYFSPGGNLAFEGSWNEYYLGDNQGAEKVRLHHKELSLIYRFGAGWTAKAGLQHFVQWGGRSEFFGEQPAGLTDYLRIISGRKGGENSSQTDQDNALGGHLGSWELYITKETRGFTYQFIYNNLFEDGSGSRLANTPDGRYGFFVENRDQNQLINSFIYEFYYTREQSQTGPHLYDNYFDGGVYAFGWTYKGRIIGVPFFSYDSELNEVVNNKFLAHHVGFAGQFSTSIETFPYKVLLSYAHNEGTYFSKLNPEGVDEDVLNFYSKFRILNLPVQADVILGMELNSVEEPKFAAGISLSKGF